jgi:hypothetical protein
VLIVALLDFNKEDGLEVNAEVIMCMFMTRQQTIKQNHYIKITNKSFENVAKFSYLQ